VVKTKCGGTAKPSFVLIQDEAYLFKETSMKDILSIRELTDSMMHLYTEGNYSGALELVEQNADNFPEEATRIAFWKMCLLSLCGRLNDVISVFQRALDSGLWWSELQFRDTDLDPVRDLPEFKRLVAVSQKTYEEVRKHIEPDYDVLLPDAPTSGKYPLLVAVHGRNGNKNSHMEYWDMARQTGWLVLLAQSTQPLSSDSYCWDDPRLGLSDLLSYYEQVFQKYPIDFQRVVIAGFSQGGGMAICTALSGKTKARGFIGVASFCDDPNSLKPLTNAAERIRGYFITGEKDHTLDNMRKIQSVLKENHIQHIEEIHPDLAHEFPADFETSFEKAINFIFTEKE
jgi:predicted esterase